jgi:hypothetical protein
MARSRGHIANVVSGMTDQSEKAKFMKALDTLGPHVVHKRVVPNGRDFLLGDTSSNVHEALKDLASLERRVSHAVKFDYARLENYFLLRITGKTEHQSMIDGFFESE